VIDLETTAFSPERGMIVQVGAVLLGEGGDVQPVLFATTRESGRELDPSAWIFQNSRLTPEAVRAGVEFSSLAGALQELVSAHETAAYNSPFDFGWLRSRGVALGRTLPDPMRLLAPVLRIRKVRGRWKWPSLQEAHDALVGGTVEAHDALGDAVMAAEVIREMAARGLLDARH